jgi:serine/threonine-protein kinase
VCEEDPAAPSTLAHRPLPPDLDAIVLMALRKEPDRRYAAAGQLADDLGRYLRGEPVRARPDTAGYRLRKFVTRHRGAVALAALVAALLLGATGFSWQQARARSDALAVAEAERDKAQQLSRFLIDIFAEAEPTAGGEVSARELLDRGAERLRRDLRGRPLTVAAMATAMGEAYAALGAYDQADSLYHAALRLRAGRLPPGHPDLADPLRQLGLLRGAQARYAEGIALLDSAIAVLASRDDPDGRVARARLLEHQARQLVFAGRSEEAHRALDRALALRGDVLGPDHPDLANTWDVFSALAQHERRLEDALRYRRRALALWPDSLDRRHPDYLMRLEDLARSLASLERRDTAVVVLREVLAGREAVYGPDHPDVSYSLHNLGRELAAMGERQAAIPLLERALAIREEVFGPESPTVAHIVETLAILRAREGDLEAAGSMFRRSLGIYERALGETHHETLETLGNLAHLASLRGDTLARRRWQDLRDARERAPAEAGAASAGDGPAGGDGAGAP